MKNILFRLLFIGILAGFATASMAQNCSGYVRYYKIAYPYKYNGQSKSASCSTGKTYKFLVPLYEGKDYRLSFHASSVFDNKIIFKIIDESTGRTIIDLPGESIDGQPGKSVLIRPSLEDGSRGEYPYFEFHPETSIKLQIVIEVLAAPDGEERRGCIGVLIQDKLNDQGSF
ncbi:MAG TPA: hypothetical protein DCQ31_04905 [Bacteroidales bacterium]|nr:hypothetical protein [Bacteroidales bacterium]